MKKLLLQYAVGDEYIKQMSLLWVRNLSSSVKKDADYWALKPHEGVRRAGWTKLDLINDALANYDQIVYLDTDTVIRDTNFNLFDLCGYGVGMCQVKNDPRQPDHLNTGVMFIRKSPEVVELFKSWAAQPENDHPWMEQWALNDVMLKNRCWRDLITIVPNRFNAQPISCPSDDPVIRAFHGEPNRYEKMKEYLKGLNQ